MSTTRPIFLVAALTLLAYANSFQGELVFDSRLIVLEDPRLSAVTRENLRLILTKEYWWPRVGQALYRPVTTLSYLINRAVTGTSPIGFHLVNFTLHLGNIILVYALMRRLTGATGLAWLGAAFFAVHPVNTEAVTNIVGRAELLAALGVLGALWVYARTPPADWTRLAGLLALAMLGLFSKENAVVLPAVLLFYDALYRWRREAGWRANAQASLRAGWWAVLPPLALWWAVRQWLFTASPPLLFTVADNALVGGDFWTARLTALKILGRYLWLMVWPQTLTADYSYNQIPLATTSRDPQVILAASIVAGLVTLAIRSRRRQPLLSLGIGLFFLALLPTSNLFLLCGTTMAERFLYLPSVGFATVVVWSWQQWQNQRPGPWTTGCALVLVTVLAVRTAWRNLDWQDDLTFWTRLVFTSPNSYRAYAGLAAILGREEQWQDAAVAAVNRARAILPDAPSVCLTAGGLYRLKGDRSATVAPDGSRQHTAASLHWYGESLNILLRAMELLEQQEAANRQRLLRLGKDPVRLRPFGRATAAEELGQTYLRLGRAEEAIESFMFARQVRPLDPQAHGRLGFAYRMEGQWTAATLCYWQQAVLDPANDDARRALVELYEMRSVPDAVRGATSERRLNPDCPLVHADLCQANAELVQLLGGAGEQAAAAQVRQWAIERYGCTSPP